MLALTWMDARKVWWVTFIIQKDVYFLYFKKILISRVLLFFNVGFSTKINECKKFYVGDTNSVYKKKYLSPYTNLFSLNFPFF